MPGSCKNSQPHRSVETSLRHFPRRHATRHLCIPSAAWNQPRRVLAAMCPTFGSLFMFLSFGGWEASRVRWSPMVPPMVPYGFPYGPLWSPLWFSLWSPMVPPMVPYGAQAQAQDQIATSTRPSTCRRPKFRAGPSAASWMSETCGFFGCRHKRG